MSLQLNNLRPRASDFVSKFGKNMFELVEIMHYQSVTVLLLLKHFVPLI
jgi:hypothetical protein